MWLSLPHEDWKESTHENYKFNLVKHVYPVFGKTPIDQIKRRDLKAFFDKLMVNGLSKNTVLLIKAPINGVLSHAVESELIENNPLNDLKFRKKKQKFKVEMNFLLVLSNSQKFMLLKKENFKLVIKITEPLNSN